jgi:hypothetical protein
MMGGRLFVRGDEQRHAVCGVFVLLGDKTGITIAQGSPSGWVVMLVVTTSYKLSGQPSL